MTEETNETTLADELTTSEMGYQPPEMGDHNTEHDAAILAVEAAMEAEFAALKGVGGGFADLISMLVEFVMSLLSGCMLSDRAADLRREAGRLGRARQAGLRIRIRQFRREEPDCCVLSVEETEQIILGTAKRLQQTQMEQFVSVSRSV